MIDSLRVRSPGALVEAFASGAAIRPRIELLRIDSAPGEMTALLRSRQAIPSHTLTGDKLQGAA